MLGYEFVYGNLFDVWLLLLAATPLLLFVGWHAMLLATGGRRQAAARPDVPVYVMPEDLNWNPFTTSLAIKNEIADAVLTAQMLQKDKTAEFAFADYAAHLNWEAARLVALLIPTLHIYTAASVERALGMR